MEIDDYVAAAAAAADDDDDAPYHLLQLDGGGAQVEMMATLH